MAELTLKADAGRPTGSSAARRMRLAGRVPGVVYGPGVDPIPLSVSARELRAALSTEAGINAVVTLQVAGDRFITMARELQRHPVRGNVTHVDFQVVDPNREVSADVPVNLSGEAVELHRADGVLDQQMFALTIKARPTEIPPSLELDISGLVIGAALRVSDITLPPGVSTDVDPETVVVAGQAPRVQAIEGEAAEGEAAEGQAPAAEREAGAEAAAGDESSAES